MRFFLMIITVLISVSSSAEITPRFDIPVSERDFRPEDQAIVSHSEYRIKLISCNNKDYGVIYQSIWGWNLASKLEGLCEWKNRKSLSECKADDSREIRECYNKIVDYYDLAGKYPKISIDDVSRPRRIPLSDGDAKPLSQSRAR